MADSMFGSDELRIVTLYSRSLITLCSCVSKKPKSMWSCHAGNCNLVIKVARTSGNCTLNIYIQLNTKLVGKGKEKVHINGHLLSPVHLQQQQHSIFSQASQGRLEMKPERKKIQGSSTLIAKLGGVDPEFRTIVTTIVLHSDASGWDDR